MQIKHKNIDLTPPHLNLENNTFNSFGFSCSFWFYFYIYGLLGHSAIFHFGLFTFYTLMHTSDIIYFLYSHTFIF